MEVARTTPQLSIRIKEFFKRSVPDGNGGLNSEDWVSYFPTGEATRLLIESPVKRIIDLRADDDPQDIVLDLAYQRKRLIEGPYQEWLKGQEMPVEGTPLSAWTQLNGNQVNVIAHIGIRTVEELADAPDSLLMKIRLPHQPELRTMAQRFVAAKQTNQAAAILEKASAETEALRSQLAEVMEQNRELMAYVQKQMQAEAGNKRRGRGAHAANGEAEQGELSEQAAA